LINAVIIYTGFSKLSKLISGEQRIKLESVVDYGSSTEVGSGVHNQMH
jgi:hypothetical protein